MKNHRFRLITYSSPREVSKSFFVFGVLFLLSVGSFAQSQPTISSRIDSTRMLIGEQINYEIQVEVDTTSQVIFPKGQTFAPFEVIEDPAIDTVKKNARHRLIKKYGLTQWDSGYYKVPSQKVIVNERPYLTDSASVEVFTVPVDTIKKEFFDIKPLIEVEKNRDGWWKYLLWPIIILVLIGAILLWFVFNKKPLTKEEEVAMLPAYDRALLKLKELEQSKYLLQSEHNQYYSELTEVVRSYLEEEAHVTALESTTDQLVEKLELLNDAGQLPLEKETLNNLKQVLKTADLVKFAKAEPEMKTAEFDRKIIEGVVIKTHSAIPEPTEEELLANEEYLKELHAKKLKKRTIVASLIAGFLLLISIGGSIAFFGWDYLKDNIFGHPTKELLEGDWVKSEYGYPMMTIETPKVLKRMSSNRKSADSLSKDQSIAGIDVFVYGDTSENFYVAANSLQLPPQEKEGLDLNALSEACIKMLESKGAENLIVKKEEYTTKDGVEGQKTYGRGDFVNKESGKRLKTEYEIYLFKGNGGVQLVMLVYQRDDVYASKIVERIMNSVSFKKES